MVSCAVSFVFGRLQVCELSKFGNIRRSFHFSIACSKNWIIWSKTKNQNEILKKSYVVESRLKKIHYNSRYCFLFSCFTIRFRFSPHLIFLYSIDSKSRNCTIWGRISHKSSFNSIYLFQKITRKMNEEWITRMSAKRKISSWKSRLSKANILTIWPSNCELFPVV